MDVYNLQVFSINSKKVVIRFAIFSEETSHRLLIMIISTVWIPPVILYVLYHLYKLYRKGKIAATFLQIFFLHGYRASSEIYTLVSCIFSRSIEKERKTKMSIGILTDASISYQRNDRAGEIFKNL